MGTSSAFEAVLGKLLAQTAPRQSHPAHHEEMWRNRSACGRWLALRRQRVPLTIAELAQMTGLSESAIVLIEAGLADETLAAAGVPQPLITSLAPRREDRKLVSDIVMIVLGSTVQASAAVIERVMTDLHTVDVDGVLRQELIVELSAPVSANDKEVHEAPDLSLEEGMFAILDVLLSEPFEAHILAIWSMLKEHAKDPAWKKLALPPNMTAVGALLRRMQVKGFVSVAQITADLDEEPLYIYQITLAGSRAYYRARNEMPADVRDLIWAYR